MMESISLKQPMSLTPYNPLGKQNSDRGYRVTNLIRCCANSLMLGKRLAVRVVVMNTVGPVRGGPHFVEETLQSLGVILQLYGEFGIV